MMSRWHRLRCVPVSSYYCVNGHSQNMSLATSTDLRFGRGRADLLRRLARDPLITRLG